MGRQLNKVLDPTRGDAEARVGTGAMTAAPGSAPMR
jgi:hypothetical protein